MASTKEMQARAKAKRNQSGKEQITIVSSGSKTQTMNLDDYYQQVDDSLTRGANELVSHMNPTNVDLSLLDKPTFTSKQYTVGGKKFTIYIHTNNKAVDAIARHSGRDLGSVIQIWQGSQSLIMPMRKDVLENARLNYMSQNRIKAEDTLSQSVAALRLNSNNPAVHHIAMFLAYEHKDFDASGIHAVWD